MNMTPEQEYDYCLLLDIIESPDTNITDMKLIDGAVWLWYNRGDTTELNTCFDTLHQTKEGFQLLWRAEDMAREPHKRKLEEYELFEEKVYRLHTKWKASEEHVTDARSILLKIMNRRTKWVEDTIMKYRTSMTDGQRISSSIMLTRCEHLLLEAGNVAVSDKQLIGMAKEMGTILNSLDTLIDGDHNES